MDIKSSKVLLIGATGGIGQKVAAVLLSAGANLFIVGRNKSKLEQLSTSLDSGQGNKPGYIVADIVSIEGRNTIVKAVEEISGGINVIINSAGINNFGLLDVLEQKTIQKIVDTNLTAPVQLIQILLPHLKKQHDAHILNIGSTFGSIGFAGFSVYCATKFGLRGFTEALRRELADADISVSYIAPRATDTELNISAITSMNRELGVVMDDPEFVAGKVLETLITGKQEVYIGWPERFFVKLNSLFPGLVDKAVRKQLPIIKRYANKTQYIN